MPAPAINIIGGDQAIVRFLPESTDLSLYPFSTMPSVPGGTPQLFGVTRVPQKDRQRSNKKLFSAGSPFGIANVRGVRAYMVNVEINIANLAVLAYCVRNGYNNSVQTTGYKGLPDLCLFIDYVDTYGEGNGYSWIIRYAKCDTGSISIQMNGPEITAQLRFIGIAEYPNGSPLSMTMSQLDTAIRTFGEALTYHHLVSLTVGSDLRPILSGINYQFNNNVHGSQAARPSSGADGRLWNTHYSLKPGNLNVSADLSLDSDIPAALATSAFTSDAWGDIIATINNAGTGGSKVQVITLTDALLGTDSAGGGDSGQDIPFSANVTGDALVIANTF